MSSRERPSLGWLGTTNADHAMWMRWVGLYVLGMVVLIGVILSETGHLLGAVGAGVCAALMVAAVLIYRRRIDRGRP